MECRLVSLNLGTGAVNPGTHHFSVATNLGRKSSELPVRHISNASRYN